LPASCIIVASAQTASKWPGRALTPVSDVRKEFVIPFEQLSSGHIAIQVKLNGKGPFRMIFDTGAPGVMFSGKAAKEAGIISKDARPGLLGQYSTDIKPVAVQIGDFKIDGVVPHVCDHPTVQSLASALGPLEGLVGFDVFSPDRLSIDYQAHTIIVLPANEQRIFNYVKEDKEMITNLLHSTTAYVAPAALWGFTVGKNKGDAGTGVDVITVEPSSAAAEAGLRAGDRLLSIGHRWTDSEADVYCAAGFIWPGKQVSLVVRRGQNEITLSARPREGL
jgi:hypothetical protein